MSSRSAELAGVALLGLTVTIAVMVGPTGVPATDVARTVGHHLGIGVEPLTPLRDALVWDLRVSRVLLAAAVGAALAICGVVLQALTRNALADPYLLGIASGASTGAVVVVVLGVGSGVVSMSAGAFLGAAASCAVVLLLLATAPLSTTRLVLVGIAVGQLFSALTSLVLMWTADANSTRGMVAWLLGSLAGARWPTVLACGAVTASGLLAAWLGGPALDALAFGDDTAAALGVPVTPLRWSLLLMTSLVTAVIVAGVGAIGFVGLLVPHAVRLVVGVAHRALLPLSALAGAVFLVVADTIARTAFAPQEVPVGVITALAGVPAFLVLLSRRPA